jgi:Dyp-type peroxidase family
VYAEGRHNRQKPCTEVSMRLDVINKSRSLAGNSDLTLFAPIKQGAVAALESVSFKSRIQRLLQTLNSSRSTALEHALMRPFSDGVERVARIHSVRVLVVEPENKVMLSATFEGTWESYIRVLWQKVPTLLDIIFCDTEGYVTAADHRFDEWEAWARGVQVETQFFYGMPQLTVDDVRYLRQQEALGLQATDHPEAAFLATRQRVHPVETVAWGTAAETSGFATYEAIRQGLEGLAALYRLTDLYPPITPDGGLLHRAARHLLLEFVTLRDRDELPPQLMAAARARFERQLAWLDAPPAPPADRNRLGPPLPSSKPDFDGTDVQGGIVTSYETTSHGALLMLAIEDPTAAVAFMERVMAEVTRETRAGAPPAGESSAAGQTDQGRDSPVYVNVAFTFEGLRAAGLTEAELALFPLEFREGMAARASMLGDLRTNHPRRWKLPRAYRQPAGASPQSPLRVEPTSVHLLLQLRLGAAVDPSWKGNLDDPGHPLHPHFARWRDAAESAGLRLLAVQPLQRLFRQSKGQPPVVIEHFGFADGDSGSDPHVDPRDNGRTWRNQVHLGELLQGHANAADAEPHPSDDNARRRMAWLRNGSFMVVRKLAQDVRAFERAVDAGVRALAPRGGAKAKAALGELLRAKLVGRWDDGRSLTAPDSKGNDFDFRADPSGSRCPFHAHIRRANPRLGEAGFNELPGRRPPRIARRGMSYGPAYDPTRPEREDEERGLVFMAYNADLAEQFEVVQSWLSGGNSSGGYSGQSDPLVGVPENGRQRHVRFEITAEEARQCGLADQARVFSMALDGSDDALGERAPFVRLDWGAYLFAPSISALGRLRDSLARHRPTPEAVWSVADGRRRIDALQALEREQGPEAAAIAWKVALEDPVEQERFHSASIWAAIRAQHGGALRTPYGVLLAEHREVMAAFAAEGDLSVCGYHQRMARSIGEIYLGLDDGPDYQRLSAKTNAAIAEIRRDAAFAEARGLTAGLLENGFLGPARQALVSPSAPTRWELTLDLKELIDPVLGLLCRSWFGLPSTDTEDIKLGGARWDGNPRQALYPGSFTAPSRHAFQPRPGATVQAAAERIGAAATAAFTRFVKASPGALKCPVGAAIRQTGAGDEALTARTLVGAMMGFLPTADGNLRRVLNEWLRDGSFWSLRAAWLAQAPGQRRALAEAERCFLQPMVQAMQLRPSPEVVWRTATRDGALGRSDVRQGDTVVLSIVSATQQRLAEGVADLSPVFGGVREAGGPTHACPGYEAAMGVLLGFITALMDCPDAIRASAVPLALVFEGALPAHSESKAQSFEVDEAAWAALPKPDPKGGKGEPPGAPRGNLVLGLGDSWFHYFAADCFDVFKYELGLDASTLAVEGTQILEMAAQPRQLQQLDALIQSEGAEGRWPCVILLSACGNDVVHPRLKELLVDRRSIADLNDALAVEPTSDFVDVKLRAALTKVLRVIDAIAEARVGRRLPILLHGYANPYPDGRGALGSALPSWLKPSFDDRGYDPDRLDERHTVMAALIDRLNRMQQAVAMSLAVEGLDVRHIDLRPVLKSPADWQNELHPTTEGFKRAARRLAQEVRKTLPGSAGAGTLTSRPRRRT